MKQLLFAALAVAASLTACGGGGASGSTPNVPRPPTVAPSNPPSTPPTTPPSPQSVLNTAMLNGAAGFVAPSNFTVYTFDADNNTPNVSNCNGACATVWPAVAPPAGAHIAAPWSTFVRSDGTMQLAYSGRPLYTFTGDSNPGDTHGDKLVEFGAEWDIARPGPQSTDPPSSPPSTPPPTPPMHY